MDRAFKYLKKYKIEKESNYPYNAKDGKCKYDKSKGVTGVSGYKDLSKTDS